MTGTLPVSVVIVSHGRADALALCLKAVAQLRYPSFEVVIVTDKAGAHRLWSMPEAAYVKLIRFDDANISVARNLGISEAAGEIIAFIDDDAIPEPSWLTHLVGPFAAPNVTSSGGFVRGRNGISWQWRAQSVDLTGRTINLFVDPAKPTLLSPTPEKAIKTVGTNMAVRRAWLADQGGFDPGFRYYLDETDVNMRLASYGCITAVVPMAQVHHGFAANATRDARRVPTNLYEIGASWTIFLDKHCPLHLRKKALARVRRSERARAIRFMQSGHIEPRDVKTLMRSLEEGLEEGHARGHRHMPKLPDPSQDFQPFPADLRSPSVVIAGRTKHLEKLTESARGERAAGRVVTMIALSPTILRHRVRFDSDGVWKQTGGMFGRADRQESALRFWNFASRVNREVDRIKTVRLIE